MKTSVTFTIDFEILGDFLAVVKKENSTPDYLIEKIIKNYIKNPSAENSDAKVNPELTTSLEEYIVFTKDLLKKCKKYKVGQLANLLLRGLLERGIATEEEVEAMQKITSWNLSQELNLPYGDYSNINFGLNFPLLVEENGNEFLKAKAYKKPVKIYGKYYRLCAQWFEQESNNDRIPLEQWIQQHLPKWFEKATGQQKEELNNFIKMNI